LFLTTSDGSTTVRLTSNSRSTDDGAMWSPDFDLSKPGHQGWIAFFRQYDPRYIWGDLCIVPSDASGPPVVVRSFTDFDTPPPGRQSGQTTLSWSPDGSRIIYSPGGSVWAVTVASGAAEELFSSEWHVSNPVFSPDLNAETAGYQGEIAFGSGEVLADGTVSTSDVFVCPVEIGETGEISVSVGSIVNLTQSPGFWDEHPVWSGDGQYLAFSRHIPGTDDRGLYALELATGSQWRVTDTYYAQTRATWSPDSLYIAFSAAREVGNGKWTADIFYVSPWFPSDPVNVTRTDSSRKIEYDAAWNPAWVNDIP
jgi:WD40-like Beta Propeller Repeat